MDVTISKSNDKTCRLPINGRNAGLLRLEGGQWTTALNRWQAYSGLRFASIEAARAWFGRTFGCTAAIDDGTTEARGR